MRDSLSALAAVDLAAWLGMTYLVVKVVIGFSLIIFVHELGHFLAAKWVGIRVDRFAVGFGYRLFGWRRGEGFTLGSRPNYTPAELSQRGWGETDYCFKALPVGGYVKMLGQEDIQLNEQSGQVRLGDDPRAFTNKPVGRRMIVVSAGVVFNVLFAIVGFMCVYLVGKPGQAPEISVLLPDSPAAQAGLRSGDVILEANGQRVDTFRDIVIAQLLADGGRVAFRVQRRGESQPLDLVMQVPEQADDPTSASGVWPALQTVLVDNPALLANLPGLKAGDRITHVGGEAVENAAEVLLSLNRLATQAGRPTIPVTYERSDPDHLGQTITGTTDIHVTLTMSPAEPGATGKLLQGSQHLLGMYPRQAVALVEPGQPGAQAGLKRDDVVIQWDTVLSPLYSQIIDSIQANPGKPIPIVVRRGEEAVELAVTPRQPFRLIGTSKPRIGVGFVNEEHLAVVADTAPGTPAAELNLPRGAALIAIDGQPIVSWFDVVRVLRASAGRVVTVRYRSGTLEAEGPLRVPSSVVNELDLPVPETILAINGETRAVLPRGESIRLPAWLAARTLLEKHLGQTVMVRYVTSWRDLTTHEAPFGVAADGANVDPWQMRVLFGNADLLSLFQPVPKIIRTSNPLTAAYLAVRNTRDVLLEVYQSVHMLVKGALAGRTRTMQSVAGPVGIIGFAVDKAKAGFAELLSFLAFISVNLAVLNFLPFPVVDGGLMIFLIIEKIKGKPLSLRTQMVATLVGLATIVLVFLIVTIQDITRLFA